MDISLRRDIIGFRDFGCAVTEESDTNGYSFSRMTLDRSTRPRTSVIRARTITTVRA